VQQYSGQFSTQQEAICEYLIHIYMRVQLRTQAKMQELLVLLQVQPVACTGNQKFIDYPNEPEISISRASPGKDDSGGSGGSSGINCLQESFKSGTTDISKKPDGPKSGKKNYCSSKPRTNSSSNINAIGYSGGVGSVDIASGGGGGGGGGINYGDTRFQSISSGNNSEMTQTAGLNHACSGTGIKQKQPEQDSMRVELHLLQGELCQV
jgi:hypothetical protein